MSVDPIHSSADLPHPLKMPGSPLTVSLEIQGVNYQGEVTIERNENNQLILIVTDQAPLPENRFKETPLKIYLTNETQETFDTLKGKDANDFVTTIVQRSVKHYMNQKIAYPRNSDVLFKMTDKQITLLVPKDNKLWSWLQRTLWKFFGLTPGPGYRQVTEAPEAESKTSDKILPSKLEPTSPSSATKTSSPLTVDLNTVKRLGVPKRFRSRMLKDPETVRKTLDNVYQSLSYLKDNGISVASPVLGINEAERIKLLDHIFSFMNAAKEQNIDSFPSGAETVSVNDLVRLIDDEPDLLALAQSKLAAKYEQIKPPEQHTLILREIQKTEQNYQKLLEPFLRNSNPIDEKEAAMLGIAFDPNTPPQVNIFRLLEVFGIINKDLAKRAEEAYHLAYQESISFSDSLNQEGFTQALEKLEAKGLTDAILVSSVLLKLIEYHRDQFADSLYSELQNFLIAPTQRAASYSLFGKDLLKTLHANPDASEKLNSVLALFREKITAIKTDEHFFYGALAEKLGVSPPDNDLPIKRWLEQHREDLEKIESLDLSKIPLSTLPSAIQKLTHLKELKLHGESLTYLPQELSTLWSLKRIDLRGYQDIVADPVIGAWSLRYSPVIIAVDNPIFEVELKKMGLNVFRVETIKVPGKDGGYQYTTDF